MKYIVANWKQHKTEEEAVAWLHDIKESAPSVPAHIVVAAPFPLLPVMRETIDMLELPIGLAAQDISAYPDGAYTGEVGVQQLKYLVDSVIIGHSERRMYFGDTNTIVAQKVAQALDGNLRCFVCIADQITSEGRVPQEAVDVNDGWFEAHITSILEHVSREARENIMLVYEPISAISTFGGKPLTAEQCAESLERVSSIAGTDIPVLYGGSVNAENIRTYWHLVEVAGAMPGNASLSAQDFAALLHNL